MNYFTKLIICNASFPLSQSYLAFNEELHQISNKRGVFTPLLPVLGFEGLSGVVGLPREEFTVEELAGSLSHRPM